MHCPHSRGTRFATSGYWECQRSPDQRPHGYSPFGLAKTVSYTVLNKSQIETLGKEGALEDLTSSGSRKIPALTGIRGYAAYWVVLFHVGFLTSNVRSSREIGNLIVVRSGYLGVDLFFILSGYVLTLTYGKNLRTLNWPALRAFAIGRLFRILPLHWLVLVTFVIASPWLIGNMGSSDPRTLGGLLASFFLVQSWVGIPLVWNGPAWSLSAEWLAYLGFPFMAVGIMRIQKIRTALILLFVGLGAFAALCLFSHQPGLDHTRKLGLLRCLFEFPAGMLICRTEQLRPLTRQIANRLFVIGAALLIPALASTRLEVLALPAFSLVIASCAAEAGIAERIFGSRPAFFLGEISFSIYLVHFLLMKLAIRVADVVDPGDTTMLVALLVGVAMLVIPIAWITWRWIEIPAVRWGRTFTKRHAFQKQHERCSLRRGT